MPQKSASSTQSGTGQTSLSGRRATVTGGTTGIGRAIAVALAREGARVFVCGRNPDHLADALAAIAEVGDGSGLAIDLSSPESVERFFDEATGWLGGLDVAVVNAAVPAQGLVDTPPDETNRQIAIDFTSAINSTQQAINRMQPGADVVLIGSMSAVSRRPGTSIYVAAKTGLEGFASALRKELADKDIKVGLIEPGFTGSDFQYPEYPPEKQRQLIDEHRMLKAEDIALAACFMLTQPRRSAVSLVRVETRLDHP